MPVPLINRATNTVEQLDEAKAQEALRSGKYALKKGQLVNVVNGAGKLGTLDAAALATAGPDIRFALPSEVAREEEVRKAAADAEKYGSKVPFLPTPARAISTFEGAARGLTLGLSDFTAINAAKAFGGEEAGESVREHLRGYKEGNPVEAFGGEVGGALAPVILSGGGAAAGAIRGAGALPRGVAAIGEGVEGLAARALGEGGGALAKVAKTAVARGAAGAVEGGIYGYGSQVSEDALGGAEATGAKALAAIGHGAFLGGVAGGLLGGSGAVIGEARDAAGRWLSQLRARDIDAVAERQFGHAAPGVGDAILDLWSKGAGLATGTDPALVKAMFKRRAELANIAEVRAQSSREVRSYLDMLLDSNREITDEARGVLKADYVKRAVRKGNEVEVGDAFVGSLNDVRSQLREMLEAPKAYGEKRVLTNAMEYVDDIARRADDAMKGADPNAQLFMLGDEFKRAIGRWTKGLQAVERAPDPLRVMRGRATRDKFEGIYDGLRRGLEDEALWGKAAIDQRTINEAWSKQIDAHRVFDARLTTNVGRDPKNPWVDIRRVDPAKADAYVAGLMNPNNDLVHTSIQNYVGATKSLAEAVGRSYELPPEKLLHVERVGRAADEFSRTLGRAADALTLGNQYQALAQAGSRSGIAEAATMASALGHPLVGAAGALVDAVANPAKTIARIAALERLVNKSTAQIDSSVKGFFRHANVRPALRAAGNVNRTAPASVSLFAGDTRAERRQKFDDEVARIRALAANPDMVAAGTARSLAGLDQAAPKVSAAMAKGAANGVAFLASKIPPGMVDTKSLTPHLEKPAVSDAEMARFARYVTAVDKPKTVLDDFEHGRVTPEQVEALKMAHAPIYDELRERIIDGLVEQKTPLPYGRRVELGVLFGVPTDATLDPDFLRALQQVQATTPEESEPMAKPRGGIPGAPGKPLDVAKQMQTPFGAITEGAER